MVITKKAQAELKNVFEKAQKNSQAIRIYISGFG